MSDEEIEKEVLKYIDNKYFDDEFEEIRIKNAFREGFKTCLKLQLN